MITVPYESEKIEYKLILTDEIYKEVVAFANTKGGVIYIGVDDNGNEVGIDNVDDTYTRLTNGIRDAIAPDITMFIHYELQSNNVIKIEIGEGTYKPYYLKSKGMKPNGVYVRQGASSAQASPDKIRSMIKIADGDVFEERRAVEQELTFNEAAQMFGKYNIDFSPEKYITLGLRGIDDELYTNLALVLSDQCRHTVKIAVFGDDENTVFKDAREFGGSVFKQLEDCFSYLTLCNRTAASFNGLERLETSDYPEEALREALLNAIIHRDYSYSGSIIINVNSSCMEFISIGGLLPGLSAEDILNGISQPRNRKLAEIFHRLRLIEAYGTGIRRIFSFYKELNTQPKIEVTPNTFKLVLPNMNYSEEKEASVQYTPRVQEHFEMTAQMKTVLDYLSEYGELSDEELQELLGIKKTRAYLLTRQMNEQGLIEIVGRGALKKYIPRV